MNIFKRVKTLEEENIILFETTTDLLIRIQDLESDKKKTKKGKK